MRTFLILPLLPDCGASAGLYLASDKRGLGDSELFVSEISSDFRASEL
jgi:hypothetical protein